ncbi:MAG: A/G-specific DNA-adenine glycosylase [Bacteroidetes bacterium]|nr:A/G-specific DNA-adenine glycosylase [Bacteroidota bacterium]
MLYSPDKIQSILRDWYDANKRELPWREVTDPYKIWISEIILQQTRVNQGYDYYLRFIGRFPDVISLASADEDEVMRYWQGLGYYSRARNLHKAAKQITHTFGGKFPTDYHEVLSLSGVGDYTAAAICSLAYKQPYAVVDGNVYRVLSRLTTTATPIDTSAGKKEFAALAQQLLDTVHPDIHNQAMMDFGALQCTPANPDCVICPLKDYCLARQSNTVSQFPVKQGKNLVTNRYFHYFHITCGEYTYLHKREADDIWKNLYEFPLIETGQDTEFGELSASAEFQSLFGTLTGVKILRTFPPMKHVLSHRVIYARFYRVRVSSENECISSFLRIRTNELNRYAVSRLTERYLEQD